jgi:hypothetical protein
MRRAVLGQKGGAMHPVEIWIPLIVGIGVVAVSILIHATAVVASLHFVRRERRHGRVGRGFGIDLSLVGAGAMIALMAHLVAIAVWALCFMLCGEFQALGLALYHSAVNYTSLGYGDVVMSPAWKLLGPLEAADGLLMFGISTAMLFELVRRMAEIRFPDLQD